MRLVLVRHAETDESAHGRCYGSLDVRLSAAGREQCVRLGQALAGERIATVVSSPRMRAVETARAIAEPHHLVVAVEPALRELDFGELEGRTYDEIAASRPELYARWMTCPTQVRFPGGESYADLRGRALPAIDALRHGLGGGTGVVVTHGGIVRAVLADVLGIPDERIFRVTVDPASLTVVEWVDSVPVARVVNRSA